MVLPNSLIAGVNKSGTTAVFNRLAASPDVCASSVKETHYFDGMKYGLPLPGIGMYESYFTHHRGERCVLEATPGYFYGGARLAAEIDRNCPGIRVVVVLREPGARAFSWWRFCRSRLLVSQDLTFAEYLARCEPLGVAPESDPEQVAWRGLSGGRYSEWLPGWDEVLGDRLLVRSYEDLRTRFDDVVGQIAEHFGVTLDRAGRAAGDNVTMDIRRPGAQRIALALNATGGRVWRRFPAAKRHLRSLYYRLNARTEQEVMSATERSWLNDYYRAEIETLREMRLSWAPDWLREGTVSES